MADLPRRSANHVPRSRQFISPHRYGWTTRPAGTGISTCSHYRNGAPAVAEYLVRPSLTSTLSIIALSRYAPLPKCPTRSRWGSPSRRWRHLSIARRRKNSSCAWWLSSCLPPTPIAMRAFPVRPTASRRLPGRRDYRSLCIELSSAPLYLQLSNLIAGSNPGSAIWITHHRVRVPVLIGHTLSEPRRASAPPIPPSSSMV